MILSFYFQLKILEFLIGKSELPGDLVALIRFVVPSSLSWKLQGAQSVHHPITGRGGFRRKKNSFNSNVVLGSAAGEATCKWLGGEAVFSENSAVPLWKYCKNKKENTAE